MQGRLCCQLCSDQPNVCSVKQWHVSMWTSFGQVCDRQIQTQVKTTVPGETPSPTVTPSKGADDTRLENYARMKVG